MFETLPASPVEMMDWTWEQVKPYVDHLLAQPLTTDTMVEWLNNYTRLNDSLSEVYARLYLKTVQDTSDEAANANLNRFLDTIFAEIQPHVHALQRKLVESNLQPDRFELPLQRMKTDIALFREENIALILKSEKLSQAYDAIIGDQTVMWEGQETTLPQMSTVLQSNDRTKREQAWRTMLDRQLTDRDQLNELWGQFLDVRLQMAHNAGYDNFRDYQWQRLTRFDYTPQDCLAFHDAIAEVVVSAATRYYEQRRALLGVDTLRPWDLDVDPLDRPALHPFDNTPDFIAGTSRIFHNVDPVLGGYFDDLHQNSLLDLDNRKGKAPGGFCITLDASQKPFVFMNAVGVHDDLQTILHEGGHAFHAYECWHWPYSDQREAPIEFAEVASTTMELLTMPYIGEDRGGFYSLADAKRAYIENLTAILYFWPYMSVVDSFQHWVYENPALARDTTHCDEQWASLWQRFMQGVSWDGLETEMMTGWHRKLHIFQLPFYYIEYGIAQLGAVQIWRNARQDQTQALADYRNALQLGGTADLPTLYGTAGAKFTFDRDTLAEAVALIESQLTTLEADAV